MDINNIIFNYAEWHCYYFEKNNIIVSTVEKIGSSFLDELTKSGYCDYFKLKLDYNKNIEFFYYDKGFEQTKTEKQINVLISNIKEKNIEIIFLTREPSKRFISGFFQVIVGDDYKNFYKYYDYFLKTNKNSYQLIYDIKNKTGFNITDNEIRKYINRLLVDIICLEFHNFSNDQHINSYNQYLTILISVLKITNIFKKINVVNLTNLNNILIKKNIIKKEDLKNIKKESYNKSKLNYNSDGINFNQFIDDSLHQIYDVKKINHFKLFQSYYLNYIQNETILYYKLLEEYGETD